MTIFLVYPMASRSWDTIANYGDPLLNAWILAWDAHALVTDPASLFNANIFYPYSNTLAYSEHLLGIAIPAAPLLWATDNAIFVHNLAVLGSFVLSGLGAYLLAGALTRSRYAGWIAGIAFAFAGYRFSEISQLQNVTVQWLPFMFLYLTRFFRNESLGTWRNAGLFGLFFLLQVLSNNYYAVYTVMAVGLYLIFRLWRAWRVCDDRVPLTAWRRLGLVLVIVMIVFVAAFLPYLAAKTLVGERSLKDQDGANLRDYISVPETNWLASVIPAMRRDAADGKSYFPGFTVLGLALVAGVVPALRRARRGRREIVFYLGLALMGFVLSLGPELQLTPGGPVIFRPLPYTFLHQWAPGVSGMRVPARMALLVIFATAILAGYGAAHINAVWRGRRALLGLLLFALIFERFTIVAPGRPIEVGAEVPPVYRALSQLPTGVVLELPATTSPWFWQDGASMERLARQQYYSTYHWQPTIMGYSGYYPPLFSASIDRILHFPASEALSYLRGLDVRYLVLHEMQFEPSAWAELSRRLPLFADQIVPMQSFGRDHLFALVNPETPRRPVEMALVVPKTLRAGREEIIHLMVMNPNPDSYPRLRQEKYTLTYVWQKSARTEAHGTRTGYLPLTHPAGESAIPLLLPVPDVRGPTEVRLRLEAYGQVLTSGPVITLTEHAARPDWPDAADLNFDNRLRLLQVTLDQAAYRPGDSLALTVYWQKLTPESTDDLIFFSNLAKEPDLRESFSNDMTLGAPAAWRSRETVVTQRLQTLPLTLSPGAYRLRIGVYDGRAQQFVPVIADDGSVLLRTYQTEVMIR